MTIGELITKTNEIAVLVFYYVAGAVITAVLWFIDGVDKIVAGDILELTIGQAIGTVLFGILIFRLLALFFDFSMKPKDDKKN